MSFFKALEIFFFNLREKCDADLDAILAPFEFYIVSFITDHLFFDYFREHCMLGFFFFLESLLVSILFNEG